MQSIYSPKENVKEKERVMVFGTFDLLHPGHRSLMLQAQALGTVTVVVARDESVLKIKGKKPCENEQKRARGIKNAFPNANVMLGDSWDFLAPLRKVQPDLLVLGYDQKLPPGVSEADLPCPVLRASAFQPEKYKSSLLQKEKNDTMSR